MKLSKEQIKEIASYIDIKDVCLFIKDNMCNYKMWLLSEKGEQVIIVPTEIRKYKDEKLDVWIYY